MAETMLRVRLTPRGGKDALNRFSDDVLHARVSAPPVDGAANRALLALLADALGVPKSHLSLHSGATGREKVIRIEGITRAEVETRLAERLR
jgi:uncharacterized protein (TIGR00251 family)